MSESNCYTCVHASRDAQGFQCAIITEHRPREEAVRSWCSRYCDQNPKRAGAPLAGAGGCPGYLHVARPSKEVVAYVMTRLLRIDDRHEVLACYAAGLTTRDEAIDHLHARLLTEHFDDDPPLHDYMTGGPPR